MQPDKTTPRYETRPRTVTAARYIGGYKLWLTFDDGRTGIVDLANELHGEALEALRDPQCFSQVYVDPGTGTLAWPQGADMRAEVLYEKLRSVH